MGIACKMAAGVVLAGFAGTVLGTDFTWKNAGGTANQWWDYCPNWKYTGSPSPCYPADSGDNATFPKNNGTGPWVVKIIDGDPINQLTIVDSVDFAQTTGSPCLVFDKIVINPSIGGLTSDVVITIHDSALIGTVCDE